MMILICLVGLGEAFSHFLVHNVNFTVGNSSHNCYQSSAVLCFAYGPPLAEFSHCKMFGAWNSLPWYPAGAPTGLPTLTHSQGKPRSDPQAIPVAVFDTSALYSCALTPPSLRIDGNSSSSQKFLNRPQTFALHWYACRHYGLSSVDKIRTQLLTFVPLTP